MCASQVCEVFLPKEVELNSSQAYIPFTEYAGRKGDTTDANIQIWNVRFWETQFPRGKR